jgi:uncharacterized protein YcbX
MAHQPTVRRLSVTAIKGFRLRHPEAITLTAGGAVGDRDFMLVDDTDRVFSITRTGVFLPYWSHLDAATGLLSVGRGEHAQLTDRPQLGAQVHAHLFGERYVDGRHVEGPWDALFSALAGISLRLVRTDTPSGGFDLHPVTVLAEASVAALGPESDGAPLDSRRFRLLITCDGLDPFAEEAWEGAELTVGSAVLRMGGPVPRCAAVQRHPDDPGKKLNTLRRLHEVRGSQSSELGRTLNLGVYAEVLSPGTVSLGDRFEPR